MPNRDPLTDDQIQSVLREMKGWTFEDGSLKRSFEFGDFRKAIAFMVEMAFCAEEMNHHPELTNVYNSVTVALSTHDAGGKVTGMDVELARRIQEII